MINKCIKIGKFDDYKKKKVEGYEKDLFQLKSQFQLEINQTKTSMLNFCRSDDLKHLEDTMKNLNEIRFKAAENQQRNSESIFEMKIGDLRKELAQQTEYLQKTYKAFQEDINKSIADADRIYENRLKGYIADIYEKMNKVEDNFIEILREKERVLERLTQALGSQMEKSFAMEQGSMGNIQQIIGDFLVYEWKKKYVLFVGIE